MPFSPEKISPCVFRYRENGYISHAIPTPIIRNSASDQSAYLIRAASVCLATHASATDTSTAKLVIAAKWLSDTPLAIIQLLRPRAIAIASSTPSKFTIPAAAMNRVP
jgi:hypothetical protein